HDTVTGSGRTATLDVTQDGGAGFAAGHGLDVFCQGVDVGDVLADGDDGVLLALGFPFLDLLQQLLLVEGHFRHDHVLGTTGNSASLCLGNSGNGVDGSTSIWNDSSDFTLVLGGTDGVYGNGGGVDISKGAGSIVTTGARAMGIAAQSIGGGGGLVSNAGTNIGFAAVQASPNQISGSGGAVSVELAGDASIMTFGAGAWGIFAQSVGGGGGFAGDPSAGLDIAVSNSVILSDDPLAPDENGGDIQISITGDISTGGANAHGIVAQSVGGGGGIYFDSANDWLEAGNSAQWTGEVATSYAGNGGSITITQDAGSSIQLTGPGSIGIVAQSTGTTNDPGVINITVNGNVQGGSSEDGIGNGVGIEASGGVFYGSNPYQGGEVNVITIGSTGSVGSMDGVDGWAISTESGIFNLTNNGTITGAIDLGAGTGQQSQISTTSYAGQPGAIGNYGTINSGYLIGTTSLFDYGRLSIYGDGRIGTTSVTQSYPSPAPALRYNQLGSGVLAVDIDALSTQTADLLWVDGLAQLDGIIVPTPINLLPGRYQVVTSTTQVQGSPTTPSTLLFDWSLDVSNTAMTLSPQANFTPSGATLTENETAVADYLQSTWNVGGSTTLAPVYADLYQVQDASDFQDLLDNLSSQNIVAQASDQAMGARTGLGAAMSCPTFEGDGTLLRETTCTWFKATRSATERRASDASPAYDIDGWSLRAGGQYALSNDWFVGATLAYNSSNTNADAGRASSEGEGFDVGVALKRQLGNWLLAGGLNIGRGWYDNQRSFDWHDHQGRLQSGSRISHLGARLRAAYEIPFERWYLRPRLDLDLLHTRMPSYQESGGEWFALDIDEHRNTSFALAPALEAGARLDLDNGWIGRLYVAAGVMWLSDDSWETKARLVGAPAAAGTFITENRLPQTLGSLDLGLQLYQSDAFEARLEYGLQSGDDYFSQSGSLRIAYRF
ncbi:MAG: autotransporter outer membrane beta-barrel domain-containing protein, partial [Sphingobacteriia bacterium]|nr:autotransporter outer membrane beta-barrel domain-containing protein [Sphingobacteriia bacterium]